MRYRRGVCRSREYGASSAVGKDGNGNGHKFNEGLVITLQPNIPTIRLKGFEELIRINKVNKMKEIG